MTSTKRFTTIEECRYCDGTAKHYPYGTDESLHCRTCNAEWDGVPVRVEVGFCHLHQEVLLDGESCFTCEDHAETARLMMEDIIADEIEDIEQHGPTEIESLSMMSNRPAVYVPITKAMIEQDE